MKGINYLLKEVGIGVIFEPRVGYRHRHKINYSLWIVFVLGKFAWIPWDKT